MYRRLTFALLVWTLTAFGQQQYPQAQYPQPQYSDNQQQPGDDTQHGVARLSIVQGDVNVRRGDNGQLSGAVVNTPLVSRDHLETSPGSRAEVQLDAVNILRLGPNTDAGFANLQYRRAQIQLGIGTVIYRVLGNSEAQVEIDTPSVGIRALGVGEYRISVLDNGTSQITVRSGALELSGPRGSERIEAGHTVQVRGDANDPEMQNGYEVARDQFDDWSADRDREEMPAQASQYTNSDVQGSGDLDRNGNWVPSGYGQVWHPQGVAPDWSPYSDGQWVWEDYYGWTWIDAAPWGWAPYHYGRWFYNTGYGWCWWPGARVGYSYWSPALVGFFGFGGRGFGVGVGLGFGGFGWVALAPYEVFHPWWGRGGYGFGATFAIAGFRNAGIRGGALVAGYNGSFGGVRQRFAAATHSQLVGASGFAGRLPFSAGAASYRFSSRAAVANPRLSVAQNRTYFHSAAVGGARSGFAGAGRAPSGGSGGWQRFGSPASSSTFRQGYSQRSEQSGWHSFGEPQSGNRAGYGAPGQRNAAPQPRYSAPAAPRYSAPSTPRYSAPAAPRYSAPAAPRYNAPAAPRYSAPPARGGESHPSSGGGHSNGGGGGHSSGGGGRHGR
jgi:hypothetical protein